LVVAFDLNPAQLFAAELKKAAIAGLDHPEFLAFLGFRESRDRRLVYLRLRGGLSPEAAGYFDGKAELVERGLIHAGKFERYFRIFHRFLLPLVHSKRDIAGLLRRKSRDERIEYYRAVWDNRRFDLLFSLFFNRFTMGRFGRDPEFFRYVDPLIISDQLKARTRYALTELETSDNPFLRYILTGGFGNTPPHYAREENFALLRANLDRLVLFRGSTADVRRNFREKFAFFNLSDIFEYLSPELCRAVASDLAAIADEGALAAYYNMMVERRLPHFSPEHFSALSDMAARLFAGNRAFFYREFIVERANCNDL